MNDEMKKATLAKSIESDRYSPMAVNAERVAELKSGMASLQRKGDRDEKGVTKSVCNKG